MTNKPIRTKPRQKLTSRQFSEVLVKGKTENYEAEVDEDGGIIIDNIEVTEDIELNKFIVEKDIIICENTSFLSFEISGGKFQSIFWIKGGEFHSPFMINGGEFHSDFLINGGEFQSTFWIGGGEFQSTFEIRSSKFKQLFLIKGGEFQSPFMINGGEFQSDFCIDSGEFQSDFLITDGEFQSDFLITGGEFQSFFMIAGGEFQSDFLITGGEFQSGISIEESKISKQLTISENAKLMELALYHSTGLQVINGTKIGKLYINNYFNTNSLKLIGVKSLNKSKGIEVEIQNSSLGNTEIIGCDWSNGTLTVDNSKIIDIFYTDTIFPIDIRSIETNKLANINQVRDTYSQLKTIADKQNDRRSSLYFQAKSNEQILLFQKEKLLKIHNSHFYWRFAIWKADWWDWFQLYLSKLSNNFGTNYRKAVLNMVIVGAITFGLYLTCLNGNLEFTFAFWKWPLGFWYGFTHHFGDFLGFLNPARKYDYLTCNGMNCFEQLALTIDWLSRIFIGFFLYGAIQAFRKYGKK